MFLWCELVASRGPHDDEIFRDSKIKLYFYAASNNGEMRGVLQGPLLNNVIAIIIYKHLNLRVEEMFGLFGV